MKWSRFLPILCLWLAAFAPQLARASKYDLRVPSEVHVTVVDGEVWRMSHRATEIAADVDPWHRNSDGFLASTGINGLPLTVYCPDIDEQVTKVRFSSAAGLFEKTENAYHSQFMWVNLGLVDSVPDYSEKVGHAPYTIEWWCKPLVGKSEKYTIKTTLRMVVELDPKTLPAKSSPSTYLHLCPPGYEESSSSLAHGAGSTSYESSWYHGECRKVDPHLIPNPKKKAKHPTMVDVEAYEWSLKKARAAADNLNAAGIYTVHDLAKTSLSNVTSVLGIPKGKSVHAAAKKAVASKSIVDPNWTFDGYFLLDPSFIVDPRIRGTKSSTNKINAAQTKLLALQSAGIITLQDLVDAKASAVATLMSVPTSKAQELIDTAKKLSVHQGNARVMKVQPDWVIHPAWLVDQALLPSVRIRRSQKKPPSAPSTPAPTAAASAELPPTVTAPASAKVSPIGNGDVP